MIRVSITGILVVIGTALLAAGITAAVPARSWEPVCRAIHAFQDPCQRTLVRLELGASAPSVATERLIAWCHDDELCRFDVLNARPSGDAHAERALCEMWAPSYRLACEQGITTRQGAAR
ncbi:MAG: hypothetical protein EXR71_05840 [Myxococcales bacterium]|nr:hypothetical protein [Myxococcales bacterium]